MGVKRRTTTLRDLLGPDPKVIALQGFRPPMGREVDRGSFHRLTDELVNRFPSYFAVVVPVEELER
jgi:hypothetical protein